MLETLTLKAGADVHDGASLDESHDTPTDSTNSSPGQESVVGSKACSLCTLSFVTVEDQRGHLKSDLHNYNLKQKLRGGDLVSEIEFEKLIGSQCQTYVPLEATTFADNLQTSTKACQDQTRATPKMKTRHPHEKKPHYQLC